MRAKIAVPIILLAGVFLFYAYWFRPQPAAAVEPATPAAASGKTWVVAAANQEAQPQPVPVELPAAPSGDAGAAPDNEAIDESIVRLEELAMNNDSDSLNLILLSLTDTNSLIREAALEAAIQFNSPEAIPWLQAALPKLEIPREKVQVLAAIEFLKLQPLSLNDGPAPGQ
jgi:hypothetical protein